MFTVTKIDNALGIAVVEKGATANGKYIATPVIDKTTHPDVSERIDARFQVLIDTLQSIINSTETVITEETK